MRQIQLPTLSLINKGLIIITVVLFLLASIGQVAIGSSLLSFFSLSLAGLYQGYVHTLVTWPFFEAHLLGVLFNGLILWFLGSELEWSWGPRRYTQFLLTSLAGSVFFFLSLSLVTTPVAWLAGLGGVSASLCIAYGILYPDRQFIFMLLFPMKAKYFCLLLAAIALYQGLFSGSKAQAFASLGAMAAGYLYMGIVMGVWAHRGLGWPQGTKKRSSAQERSHLKLVKKDDDDTPKYWH